MRQFNSAGSQTARSVAETHRPATWGGRVEECSLVPVGEPRLGYITLD
jgi:hypothetical protein